MKRIISLIGCLLVTLAAPAQSTHPSKSSKMLNTSLITDPAVKQAVESLQAGDATKWFQSFTSDAQLYDDGHRVEFRAFFSGALGHEYFTSIDKVEDNGKHLYGRFHSDKWGDFKTYFKFYKNSAGKFDKLEIGQANY